MATLSYSRTGKKSHLVLCEGHTRPQNLGSTLTILDKYIYFFTIDVIHYNIYTSAWQGNILCLKYKSSGVDAIIFLNSHVCNISYKLDVLCVGYTSIPAILYSTQIAQNPCFIWILSMSHKTRVVSYYRCLFGLYNSFLRLPPKTPNVDITGLQGDFPAQSVSDMKTVFNPRPLRPKGYCRHLRLSVCPSVCLSVCSHHPC